MQIAIALITLSFRREARVASALPSEYLLDDIAWLEAWSENWTALNTYDRPVARLNPPYVKRGDLRSDITSLAVEAPVPR